MDCSIGDVPTTLSAAMISSDSATSRPFVIRGNQNACERRLAHRCKRPKLPIADTYATVPYPSHQPTLPRCPSQPRQRIFGACDPMQRTPRIRRRVRTRTMQCHKGSDGLGKR